MPQQIGQTVRKAGYCSALALLMLGSPAMAGDILVNIEGMQAAGPVYLALVDAEQQAWPEQPLRQIQSEQARLLLRDLPPGRYAIALFQDSNGNGRLDYSRRGVPLEPVGFSTNPALLNGKPAPAKCRFVHGQADSELRIKLRQPRAKG